MTLVSIYATNPDDSRPYAWVILLVGEPVVMESHVSGDTMIADLEPGIYGFIVYNALTKVGTWGGTITVGVGAPASFSGVCYNVSNGFNVNAPTVGSWTIGDVEFPFSPSQISDEVDSVSEEFPLDGVASILFGVGKGVRALMISGSICLRGLDKTDIESTYAGPLRSYQGTQQTVASPSGAYDGDWLIKKVSFKEQAEGNTVARIMYTLTLWKPTVLVVL